MFEQIKKLKAQESALVFFSFWITVFIMRGFIFFDTLIRDTYPQIRIVIYGVHYHHYIVGFIFLAVLGIITFRNGWRKSFFQMSFLGIGLGLVFDEFYFLLHPFSENYWVFLNFLAVGLFGILLWFLVIYSPKSTPLKAKLLLISLIISLFSLFYIANPAVSRAGGIVHRLHIDRIR